MTETSLASAIVVSEPMEKEPVEVNTLKRRQSEVDEEEQGNKRQRTSPGKNSPVAAKDDATGSPPAEEGAQDPSKIDPREARRKTSMADEKQRSKRLFGALLGNLSQPGDSRTSRRRQEIESRRKAELQRQDDERVEDKLRRQEKLAERRRKEQRRVDEQNMHIRHSNLMHTANFLQTAAEPKVYYRPWDLRADEEDRIDAQIKDAQAQIDKELDDFEQRHQTNGEADGANDLRPLSTQNRTKSPEQDRKLQQQTSAEPELSREASKHTANEERDQSPAKSEDSKAAEVPDSEATNVNTNDNTLESKNGESTEVKIDTEEQEDGDHTVDGDEDAIVY